MFTPKQQPDLQVALRSELTSQDQGVTVEQRRTILGSLAEITLTDLRAAYDLSDPAQVDQAVYWLGATELRLVRTEEMFEALRPALRPDAPAGAAGRMLTFGETPSLQRPLAEALLLHKDARVRRLGLDTLLKRESTEDATLWTAALKDSDVDVRAKAAGAMGHIASTDVTRALVVALDDPSPKVRDAVLASLEAIQKIEDLKARWRERTK